MNLQDMWDWGARELAASGVDDARWQAELLLRGILSLPRAKFMAYPELEVEETDAERFRDAIRKRSLGMPVQYILGYQEFYGRMFVVKPDVLIPRPETEILVEEVLKCPRPPAPSRQDGQIAHSSPLTAHSSQLNAHSLRILDLCTGSGCIGLTLAAELAQARVVLTDNSEPALSVAKQNAQSLDLLGRCDFRQGDLFAPVSEAKFDIIVSNPPYIETEVIATLSKDVQNEPVGALDGGPDGLEFYRRIAAEAPLHLTPNGLLAVEIGHGQGADVVRLLEQAGLTNVTLIHDLADKERVVLGRKIT